MDYKEYFKGKKITIMGLGLLGRGLGDAIFLAQCGADLIVTDLKDEKALASSLVKLKKYKNIRYTLGRHTLEDFRNRDFILKAAGVPLDSPYIAEARKSGIPIEMDASLFAKLMPHGVTLVGVTGTRGKSTTTALIYEILKAGFKIQDSRFKNVKDKACPTEQSFGRGLRITDSPAVFRGGNLVPEATLPFLEKVKKGDIVVLELDSWQLQGFHDAKLSPQVAVFTTFLDDHLVYYKGDTDRYFEDKVAIFKYQKPGDVLIAGERVATLIGKSGIPVVGDFIITRKEDVPQGWKIAIPGEHNLENIACAIKVAEYFKIPISTVRKSVEDFKGLPNRLEYLRTVKGVKIYNDNNATTPDATIVGLRALGSLGSTSKAGLEVEPKEPHLILIMGGTDKGLDMSKLVAEIPKYCKAVVMLKETGTERLLITYNVKRVASERDSEKTLHATRYTLHKTPVYETETLEDCVRQSMKLAEHSDIVLFSPAFASFGKWFKNEYDRGEQFVNIVNGL